MNVIEFAYLENYNKISERGAEMRTVRNGHKNNPRTSLDRWDQCYRDEVRQTGEKQ